ncbi:DUF1287 domain-containing protein [Alkalihalobacterium chitinilyticum]|uniref:DUF1287 domain-containing protein n=1 Tax=Alkalihalobacterium chitinilyticum TaxID=2980103 RepID=A0ABT5VF98_9BACI|nr:DUF1287 domain-containing protein [Alkalihalobacterium chitinilyticum]MDE5413367.1 DUF1287 domain-containing protein [Alkalihalobacterium chitinilyticum]
MKMLKRWLVSISVLSVALLSFMYFFKGGIILDSLGIHMERFFVSTVIVPEEYSTVDRNGNGIPDPLDIVHTARKEVEQRTHYKSAYYAGGYPPNDEGVCTDVIWRGLLGADIILKDLMDEDISEHMELYPRVDGKPDPNIDFRRVPNQYVFLERHAESLTTELIPGDMENLKEWQPGDIVLFLEGYHHVGIVSDKRAKDGTPYLIHNNRPFAAEVKLSSFSTPIAGHYRWNY